MTETPRVYYRFSEEIFSHAEAIEGKYIGGPEDKDLTFEVNGKIYVFTWIDTDLPDFNHWAQITPQGNPDHATTTA